MYPGYEAFTRSVDNVRMTNSVGPPLPLLFNVDILDIWGLQVGNYHLCRYEINCWTCKTVFQLCRRGQRQCCAVHDKITLCNCASNSDPQWPMHFWEWDFLSKRYFHPTSILTNPNYTLTLNQDYLVTMTIQTLNLTCQNRLTCAKKRKIKGRAMTNRHIT